MHRTALRTLISLTLVSLIGTSPAYADELDGTVLAFDRMARVIVLQDRSVIPLDTLEGELPADLVAGDRINVRYESNEDDGYQLIHSVTRLD